MDKPAVGPSGRQIVYDKDGKPCRTCNTLLDFRASAGKAKKSAVAGAVVAAASPTKPPAECPPDVEQLGRSSWTLLHSIAATYPETPTASQQQHLKQFIRLFGEFYPCWFCAKDFTSYVEKKEPIVDTQEKFGRWLCDAHNEVNVKLGKPKFDCNLWKQRWKDGWADGSCD